MWDSRQKFLFSFGKGPPRFEVSGAGFYFVESTPDRGAAAGVRIAKVISWSQGVIEYITNRKITVKQFRSLLVASTLGERRPIDDLECLEGMLDNSNLIVTAWEGEKLVGVARSVTDFYYCCYLSDLAVDSDYQKQGIGKRLIAETQNRLGEKCKLILVAAPAANEYYRHIGFTNNERCWILGREQSIR